jgi:hypothetical protein
MMMMASSRTDRFLLDPDVLMRVDRDDVLNLMVVSRRFSVAFRGDISVENWKIIMQQGRYGLDLVLSYSLGIHLCTPWKLANEGELRDSALMLATAHRARVKLLSGRISRRSKLRSGRVVRRICNIEPTVHSEIIKFDCEAVKKMLQYWRDDDDNGLRSWPGGELFSESVERGGKKIALSISLEYAFCEDISENVEISLNLVYPDDEYCIVYFARPVLSSVEGRWTWVSKDYGDDCDRPKRRIFQTCVHPKDDFLDFLEAVCAGVDIRIVVICTGVSSSHRDWQNHNTLFGYNMGVVDRPWPNLRS